MLVQFSKLPSSITEKFKKCRPRTWKLIYRVMPIWQPSKIHLTFQEQINLRLFLSTIFLLFIKLIKPVWITRNQIIKMIRKFIAVSYYPSCKQIRCNCRIAKSRCVDHAHKVYRSQCCFLYRLIPIRLMPLQHCLL